MMEQSSVLVLFVSCLFPSLSPLRQSTHLFASRDLNMKQYLLQSPSQKTKHVNLKQAHLSKVTRYETAALTLLQHLKPCSLVHVYGRFR